MESINHAFGKALRFACAKNKRGFQTQVGSLTAIDKGYLSNIIKGAGSLEEKRRAILAVVLDLDPTFPARTYDDFLSFGQWLLEHNNNPAGWCSPRLQGADKKVIAQAIEIVEDLITESKKDISQSHKIELIIAAYDMLISNPTQEQIDMLISTVKLFFKM